MYFPTTQSKYFREQLKEDGEKVFWLKKKLSASEILCKVSTDVQSQWHIYLNNTFKGHCWYHLKPVCSQH